MVARKTAVEAWNSRFVRSILFKGRRGALCAQAIASTKGAKRRQIQHFGLGSWGAEQIARAAPERGSFRGGDLKEDAALAGSAGDRAELLS